MGSLSVLQGIFPTQESNQGLLRCRQILYQLSDQGSPICQTVKCYSDLHGRGGEVRQAGDKAQLSRPVSCSGSPVLPDYCSLVLSRFSRVQLCNLMDCNPLASSAWRIPWGRAGFFHLFSNFKIFFWKFWTFAHLVRCCKSL